MSLVSAFIVPHPPLAVPEVGHGEEMKIQATLQGYEHVAKRIAEIAPETIIIISPHTAYYADWIFVAGGDKATGNLAQFHAPQVQLTIEYDEEMRQALNEIAHKEGIPAGIIDTQARPLDHGMMVPLYYIDKVYPAQAYKAISIGGAGLPRNQLLAFGAAIAKAAKECGRKCVLLVSGDLSHKLKEEGPYGFDPAGPVFDKAFVDVVQSGDPSKFAELDTQVCENAAECGLSGFIMMAGALKQASSDSGVTYQSELISYEGPFGVGYGVATFEADVDEDGGVQTKAQRQAQAQAVAPSTNAAGARAQEPIAAEISPEPDQKTQDPLVALAYETVEDYVTSGAVPEAPQLGDDEPARAGCFVSIHTKDTGDLRGCIGTIEPVQSSLAKEIIANAVSASTRDPRFPAITPRELDNLVINVDVLFTPEPATLDDMDPKRYGIIVTQGFKRGLLLPDLEGVDTVDQQFKIACMKAGIDPNDTSMPIDIERFEVVRHE